MAAPLIAAVGRIAARASATRLAGNIARRVSRIEKAGISTNAVEEFKQLQNQPKPKTANEWREYNKQLKRLDGLSGTRMRTAKATEQREATQTRNRQLREAVADPNTRIRMSQDDLKEAVKLYRADVRRKIRNTKKAVGENVAIKRAEEILADVDLDKSRNHLLSQISRLNRASEYKTLTPTGARKEIDTGIRVFGEDYATYTTEQKSAIWRAFERQKELESLSSDQVVDIVNATIRENGVVFGEESTEDGKTRVTASIGDASSSAEARAIRRKADDEALARYTAKNKPRNPHFDGFGKIETTTRMF